MVQCLLEAGSHLDTVNAEGRTFASLLKGQPLHEVVNPLKFTNLQCLAARVIKREGIDYTGSLSPNMELFVDLH